MCNIKFNRPLPTSESIEFSEFEKNIRIHTLKFIPKRKKMRKDTQFGSRFLYLFHTALILYVTYFIAKSHSHEDV